MFSLALAEDPEGDKVIMMFDESENNTEKTVQFNAEMEIVADQDQAETQQGFGNTEPVIKAANYDIMFLEYEEPESFRLTLDPPMVNLGDDEYDRDYVGDSIEIVSIQVT